ncbi:hypothetical protein MPER_04328 [Moniliophthora perniciosa FA553]|nr:hypothetical protein MPER_04328 [Moniliophthora perniciosa FA553]
MILLNDGYLAPTGAIDHLDSASVSSNENSVDLDSEGIPDDLPTPPGLTSAPTAARQLCEQCRAASLEKIPDRWYVVWSGLRVGWVKGLDLAKELTYGIPENDWRYFPSERQARAAFLARYKDKQHRILTPSTRRIEPQSVPQPEYEPLGPAMGWVTP